MDDIDGSMPWSLPAAEALPGVVRLHRDGRRWVLSFRGEIDLAVVQEFNRAHHDAAVPVDAFDAGEVTFISCAGIAVMLRWRNFSMARGRLPVLRRSAPQVDRLLQLTGLTALLHNDDGASCSAG